VSVPKRFAWILNLDAEYELSRGGPGYTPSSKLTSQLELYGASSRALLHAEDLLLSEKATLATFDPRQFIGRAWCPTPRAIERFEALGIAPEPYPPVDVIRRVNHRRFAHEIGGGLPGQRYFERRADIDELLRRNERSWLFKRPLAFAGRGQLRAYLERPLTEKEQNWIDASLDSDGLIVEPLVEPTLEVSLHGFVWRDRRFELGRTCVQEVSNRGVFKGVRLAQEGELGADESTLRAQGEQVALALGETGYFGPFGIDAYRYLNGFCALSEINARYTMSFVTGFPRHPSELELE
jgi:hypothetical protein